MFLRDLIENIPLDRLRSQEMLLVIMMVVPLVMSQSNTTRELSFEPQTPLQRDGASATPIPPLNVSDTPNPIQRSRVVSFQEIVESKATTTELWWSMLAAVMLVIVLCASLGHLRRKIENRPKTVGFLLYSAVNKNLAVIGLTTASVRAASGWVSGVSSQWEFIMSWSYYTLFVVSIVLTLKLGLAVVGVSRQLQHWTDWEVHLQVGDDKMADPIVVGYRASLMNEIRHVFRRQLALLYPKERSDVVDVRVTAYLGELQTKFMLSMVTFHWKNWLAVCIFVVLNALRQTVVARGALVVTNPLLITDLATFVFGLGIIPLLVFLAFYHLLNRSVLKYLIEAKKQVDKYYDALLRNVSRHSLVVAGILRDQGVGENTVNMDPSAPVDVEDFVSPTAYLVFRRASMTLGMYRGCVLFNSVYLAYLIMAFAEAAVTELAWGVILVAVAAIPSIVVLLLLPWSSLLLVTVCSLGPYLEIPIIERLRGRSQYNQLYPSGARDADDDEQPNVVGDRTQELRNPLDSAICLSPAAPALNGTAYDRNLSRVHRRIEELQGENSRIAVDLHNVASERLAKERAFHRLVDSLANRPDMSPRWKAKMQTTATVLAMHQKAEKLSRKTEDEDIRRIEEFREQQRRFLTDEEKEVMDYASLALDSSGPKYQSRLHRGMTADEILALLTTARADDVLHLPPQQVEDISHHDDPSRRWMVGNHRLHDLGRNASSTESIRTEPATMDEAKQQRDDQRPSEQIVREGVLDLGPGIQLHEIPLTRRDSLDSLADHSTPKHAVAPEMDFSDWGSSLRIPSMAERENMIATGHIPVEDDADL